VVNESNKIAPLEADCEYYTPQSHFAACKQASLGVISAASIDDYERGIEKARELTI